MGIPLYMYMYCRIWNGSLQAKDLIFTHSAKIIIISKISIPLTYCFLWSYIYAFVNVFVYSLWNWKFTSNSSIVCHVYQVLLCALCSQKNIGFIHSSITCTNFHKHKFIIYLDSKDSESSLKESEEISPTYVPNAELTVVDSLSSTLTFRLDVPVTSTVLKEQIIIIIH